MKVRYRQCQCGSLSVPQRKYGSAKLYCQTIGRGRQLMICACHSCSDQFPLQNTGIYTVVQKSFVRQHSCLIHTYTMYRITENFRGRKLSRIDEKYDFRGEKFCGLLTFAVPKDATPPNFAEKTFSDSHKTPKFANVFSLESFTLYGSCYCVLNTCLRCEESSNLFAHVWY